MPLFMDLHDVPGAKAEDVAQAHVKDLYCQDQYGCKAITYWFDEARGKAFCLIEAPDEQSVYKMHENAHGLIPNEVVPVDPKFVDSFLGRLTDPEHLIEETESDLRVFEDSAYRYFLMMELPDRYMLNSDSRESLTNLADGFCSEKVREYKGNIALSSSRHHLYVFKGHKEAMNFASCVLSAFDKEGFRSSVKLAVHAGEPLESGGRFFGEPVETAKALIFGGQEGKVAVSNEIQQTYSNLLTTDLVTRDMLYLLPDETENFLCRLRGHLEANYRNPDFGVPHLANLMAYSSSKIYRMCKSLTGMSPNRLIRHYRIEQARLKLTRSSDTISEVGFSCGFNTPSYFTRCFFEVVGVNPQDYRDRVVVSSE